MTPSSFADKDTVEPSRLTSFVPTSPPRKGREPEVLSDFGSMEAVLSRLDAAACGAIAAQRITANVAALRQRARSLSFRIDGASSSARIKTHHPRNGKQSRAALPTNAYRVERIFR